MTHRICFKAWFVFFLVATIGGMFIGFFVGAIMGGVLGVLGVDLNVIKIAGGVLGFCIGVPISYFTFYWVVSQFILKRLVPPTIQLAAIQPSVPTPAPVTPTAE